MQIWLALFFNLVIVTRCRRKHFLTGFLLAHEKICLGNVEICRRQMLYVTGHGRIHDNIVIAALQVVKCLLILMDVQIQGTDIHMYDPFQIRQSVFFTIGKCLQVIIHGIGRVAAI